jgi:hypothetical protein
LSPSAAAAAAAAAAAGAITSSSMTNTSSDAAVAIQSSGSKDGEASSTVGAFPTFSQSSSVRRLEEEDCTLSVSQLDISQDGAEEFTMLLRNNSN